jgi:hypothetical protein
LKEIAEYLGFNWSPHTVSGVQTIAWRHEWETSREPTLKGAILSYNAQDCEALQLVTDKIGDLCQPFVESGNSSLMRIPLIPATHSEAKRPPVPKDSGRLFRAIPDIPSGWSDAGDVRFFA